jgi:hypothetical protein
MSKYHMSIDSSDSDSNKFAADPAPNLISEAKKLTAHGFVIIPVDNNKISIIKYSHRRKQSASVREIETWFSIGNGNGHASASASKAIGIAIALNETEFGIDTDGDICESIFLGKIVPRFSPDFQNKILSTMHTKTPRGHHRTFRYAAEDFPRGIKEKTFFRLNDGHSEIALKGKNHYLVESGPGYEIVNDVENVKTLTKTEVEEFIDTQEKFSREEEALTKVVSKLLPYFIKPIEMT